MKPKLTIHAGLGKTGTSALQKTMYSQRDYLAENGIYYPANVSGYRHQKIVQTMLAKPKLTPEGLIDFLPLKGNLHTVWSAEGFCFSLYLFPKRNLRALAKITHHYDTRIVLVLRDRHKFLWSYYKQALINPPNKRVPFYGKDIDFESFCCFRDVRSISNFSGIVRDLKKRFRAEVTVLNYDELTIAQIFKATTGVPVPDGASIERVNQSLPDSRVKDVRRINATLSGEVRATAIQDILLEHKVR